MKKRIGIAVMFGLALVVLALTAGCGASKKYVDTTVADERTRNQSELTRLQGDLDQNRSETDRLQSLVAQLDQKTAQAINQAKGFENYRVIWEGEIFFPFNSPELTTESQETLDEGGRKMAESRNTVMEIGGYCDPTGSSEYNIELGNRRAAAAKYYLVDAYGVNLFRIFTVSYGDKKSTEMTDGRLSYAKQRKVLLKLWGPIES